MASQVSRIDALRLIAQEFPHDPVVLTCGATCREMAAADRRANHLYVVDSMGLVSSIVLGLSLGLEQEASPERPHRVVGVEGDGGMLMNLNALATIGYLQPRNLLLIVLDNQAYASTGGQKTFTEKLDLAAIAGSCGLRTWQPEDLEGLKQAIIEASEVPGPSFIHLRIAPGNTPAPLLLDDPVTLGHTFTTWLAKQGNG
ncbi:MAG: phosphonopyruvate decarboxylase [Dehalococcoidia bacterium]|nr:phosphonopyruvate decarboxylase [Dehalococcoidia bacterium]MSQ17819.1 phosphonopyruvate decarboxylase [Dehalococcoidia bacterium]